MINEIEKQKFIDRYGPIGWTVLKAYRCDPSNLKANAVIWIFSKIIGRKQYREDIRRKIRVIWGK